MDKHQATKTKQLGMNISTAQHRLLKDILWSLVVETGKSKCCHCGKEMCRQTFSIEHLIPWLNSEKPFELFFDLQNISFSHLSCNISTARSKFATKEEAREARRESTRKCKQKKKKITEDESRSTISGFDPE